MEGVEAAHPASRQALRHSDRICIGLVLQLGRKGAASLFCRGEGFRRFQRGSLSLQGLSIEAGLQRVPALLPSDAIGRAKGQ